MMLSRKRNAKYLLYLVDRLLAIININLRPVHWSANLIPCIHCPTYILYKKSRYFKEKTKFFRERSIVFILNGSNHINMMVSY